MNAPAPVEPEAKATPDDSSETEKKGPSVSSETASAHTSPAEEDDLDPVALNKAFRFAAWASIILVRTSC